MTEQRSPSSSSDPQHSATVQAAGNSNSLPCPRYDPHPAHGREYVRPGAHCPGLTDYAPHHFDARMGYEEYVRCCPRASADPVHVPWPR